MIIIITCNEDLPPFTTSNIDPVPGSMSSSPPLFFLPRPLPAAPPPLLAACNNNLYRYH